MKDFISKYAFELVMISFLLNVIMAILYFICRF